VERKVVTPLHAHDGKVVSCMALSHSGRW